MKRWIGLLLALALALGAVPFAAAADWQAEASAAHLKALGLFMGGSRGFELDRQPTRAEAVVLLLRLLGKRDGEIKAYGGKCPFPDVPDWAKPYVAWAYDNGLAQGSGGSFGANQNATEQMFAVFVLRALGYRDDTAGGNDFTYAGAVSYAKSLGLPTGVPFNRGACARMMESALSAQGRDGKQLWQKLAGDGVFTEAKYREAVEGGWKKPAAGGPAYQSLYPDFYAPQPYNADQILKKTIHLTFDDGPSQRTDEVLQTLAQQNVKATFFVVGHGEKADLDRMRKIVDQGHTIGMHSYHHNYTQLYASVDSFLADFYQNFKQIQETTGVTPTAFRFPGGSVNGYNKAVRKAVIAEMERRGFVPYDWNVTSGDAASGGARVDQVIGNLVNQSMKQDRVIALCHDSAAKKTTAEALDTVINLLREEGFSFASLSPADKPYLF